MKLLNRISAQSLFLWISTAYIIGYLAHALYLEKTVYGDGIYYYAWLTFHPSKYSVGPALFWAPVYFLTHNQIAVGLTGVLATIFSLLLLWRLLEKYFGKTVSFMAIAAMAGATNLLFYGSLDVVNSHALSFFGATVFLSLLYSKQKHWFAIGAALGFLGLIRPQDFLYGILLLPFIKKENILKIGFGLLLFFSPQFFAWQLTSGKFWLSPYFAKEGFNFLNPQILGVLFNKGDGLLLWTPIIFLGIAGLIIKKQWLFLTVFITELYLVSSWSTWSQGASYSGRMFVSSLPVLSFGIASLFAWLSHYKFSQAYFLLTIIIPLSVINVLNIIYFLIHV